MDCVTATFINPTFGRFQDFIHGLFYPRLKALLVATLAFNLVDVILTLSLIHAGLAIEANPVMRALLEVSPVVFVVGKLSMVFFGLYVLWKERRRTLALVGSGAVFAVYFLLMVYHIRSVGALLG
jgi:hypothetical protein